MMDTKIGLDQEDDILAINHLSEAIRIKTISNSDYNSVNFKAFDRFIEILQNTYQICTEEENTMHNTNNSISVENYKKMLNFYSNIITKYDK